MSKKPAQKDIRNFMKPSKALGNILTKYSDPPPQSPPYDPSSNQPSSQKPFKFKSKFPNMAKNYSFADALHWTMTKYPWDNNVDAHRRDLFGLSSFRHNQKAIINATLAGRDVFVCMPTGGGKSLCFQLPAILDSGVTLVVMPLLSLIYDQVGHLENLGIKALAYTSQNNINKDTLYGIFRAPEYPKMLYLSPEKIGNTVWFFDFLRMLFNQKKLSRIVIDEAHCVSQWGRDFRPDYLTLGKLKDAFPNVPLVALTATATEAVRVDIVQNLGMRDCLYFQSSFNRPNLYYEVREKDSEAKVLGEIAQFIKTTYPKQSGIIYCSTTKEADKIAENLHRSFGFAVKPYHAKIKDSERNRTQDEWMVDDIQIIVATIAFGMGINKPNVRFVIHYSLPKSLENYYQESGRAGRDGKPSHCIIFYRFYDRIMLYYLMKEKANKARDQTMGVFKMCSFCEDMGTCRRKLQLEHFSERFDASKCQEMCDNCKNKREFIEKDCTSEAAKALNILAGMRRMTLLQLTQVLAGKKVKNISTGPLFGMLKEWKSNDIDIFLKSLLFDDYLSEKVVDVGGHTVAYLAVNLKSKKFKSLKEQRDIFKIKIPLPLIRKVVYKEISEDPAAKSKPIKGISKSTIEIPVQPKCEVIKTGGFAGYLKNKETIKVTQEQEKKPQLFETIKYENTGRIFIRQGSSKEGGSLEPPKKPTKPKKPFHSEYGYCDQEQFEEIQSRLLLIRKKIFNLKRLQKADENINIENFFPLAAIEELAKKLPDNENELTVENIRSVGVLPLKQYGSMFMEEIKHFLKMQEIDKNDYEMPKDEKNEAMEVFNMDEHIIKNSNSNPDESFSEADQEEAADMNISLEKDEEAPLDIDLDEVDVVIREYEEKQRRESEIAEKDRKLSEGMKENKIPPKEDSLDEFFFGDMMNLDFQMTGGVTGGTKTVPVEKNFKRKPALCLEITENEEEKENEPIKEKKIEEDQTLVTMKGPFKKLLKNKTDFL